MESWRKDNIDNSLLDKIIHDFFLGNTVIQFDRSISGQKIKENKFVIGPWAGHAEITNLFHEMCHFAERPIEKLQELPPFAWGFTFGKYWEIFGKSGYEPQTDQAVRTEQRVWAFQRSVQKHYGIEEDPYDTVSSATYIHAFTMFLLGQGKSNEEKLKILATETEIMSNNEFSFEKFKEDWNHRIEILKNKIA
mgnify:CR=1 FL=1